MRQVASSKEATDITQPFATAASKNQDGKKNYPSPITLRLTEAERTRLLGLASDMSMSAYFRKCVFGSRAARRVVPATDRVLLGQILARLGQTRIANNLNQIAHRANCGSLVNDEAIDEEILIACGHIAWVRVMLIEALGLKGVSKDRGQQ